MSAEATKTPRRRPARRGEGDRLREEIVTAAGTLLQESGEISTLSLRAVARAVGVATTSIYLHFDDINALVRAVKARWLDLLAAEVVKAAAEAGDDPLQRVRAIAHAYVAAGMSDPARYRVLFTSPMVPQPGAVGYLGANAFNEVLARVTQAVPASTDPHLVTVQFWCALHGLVTLRQARPAFPWPDLTRQVDDLVWRMIRSADG
jgi:AcrR family transcriptional regulator